MIDAYKIGVNIAMTNGVSPVLQVIQRDLLGLKHQVDLTSAGFDRMKLAVAGVAGVLVGGAVLGVMAKMVEHGKELVHQQALYKAAIMNTPGMTPDQMAADTAAATAQAWKTANEVLTSNVAENLKSLRELRGVFGSDEEARKNLTLVTKAASVMESVRGAGAGDQVFDMAKALEIKGVSQDPAHFEKLINAMVAASIASGGKVLGSDFLSAAKYGRTATQGWDDTFMATILPTLMQEMKSGGGSGGSGGPGNALQSAFQAVVGGVMSNKAAGEFMRLNLLDPAKVIRTSTGSVKGIQPGGVTGAKEFQADPYQWVQDVLMPALKAKGITTPEAIRDEVSHMFVNRTAQQMMTMFATMQSRFQKDAELNKDAGDTNTYDKLIAPGGDPNSKIKAFHEAWENLMTALGSPMVDTATNLITHLTVAMNDFTKWAVAHPDIVVTIEAFTAAFAGLLVLGGAIAIATAALGPFVAIFGSLLGVMAGAGAATTAAAALAPAVTGLTDALSGAAAVAEGTAALATGVSALILALSGAGVVAAILAVLKVGSDHETPETQKQREEVRKGMPVTPPSQMTPQDGYGVDGSPIHKQSYTSPALPTAPLLIPASYTPSVPPLAPANSNVPSAIVPPRIGGGSAVPAAPQRGGTDTADANQPADASAGRDERPIYLVADSRVIAQLVSKEQARAWSLPPSGATRFDGRQSPIYPSSTMKA